MFHESETEVLVCGAGPVGLTAAIFLVENGVRVRIIDQEERTATHTYACVLHPRSLAILDRFGLANEVINLGYRVERVGLYSSGKREAELDLSALKSEFPFAVVLPQSALEQLLEDRLRAADHVSVEWHHRLSDLKEEANHVLATVDRFCHSAKGYIVPSMEWEVQASLRVRAGFVVGADGSNSTVRHLSGIGFSRQTAPRSFAVYETECDDNLDHEARVVLDAGTCNVMWPVARNRCRWTFQLREAQGEADHWKDRSHLQLVDEGHDDQALRELRDIVTVRAPWFGREIKAIDWSTIVQFNEQLVNQFGHGRCWLAGDAAHQTSPIGMQSMNVGLWEAAQLADVISQLIKDRASWDLLKSYDADAKREWSRLFGLPADLNSSSPPQSWAARHVAEVVGCIPASGVDFSNLLYQLLGEPALS